MMSNQVMITLPVELPAEVLRAIRNDPLTSCEDRDEMNTRIGWLLCAWDIIRMQRLPPTP
jgi:hypothetical protein